MSLPSVIAVYIVPESERGSQTATEQKITLTYRVEFDGPAWAFQGWGATDGEIVVPDFGDDFSSVLGITESTGLFVNDISPQTTDNPNFIDIYVTFSNAGGDPNQTGKWNVDISVSGIRFCESTTKYADGSLITNSAGDVYDPKQDKIYYDEKVSVSFTTDDVDGDGLATIRGKVNTDEVSFTIKGITRTFAIGTLLMDEVSYKVVQSGAHGISPTFSNYSVNFDMLYRIDTWKKKLVDEGTRDADHVPFQNNQGPGPSPGGSDPVTSPIYMDGSGGALIGAGAVHTTDSTVPAVLLEGKLIQDSIAFLPFLEGIA